MRRVEFVKIMNRVSMIEHRCHDTYVSIRTLQNVHIFLPILSSNSFKHRLGKSIRAATIWIQPNSAATSIRSGGGGRAVAVLEKDKTHLAHHLQVHKYILEYINQSYNNVFTSPRLIDS
jgi:hypothetical protein